MRRVSDIFVMFMDEGDDARVSDIFVMCARTQETVLTTFVLILYLYKNP